jgi:hypothetical protein
MMLNELVENPKLHELLLGAYNGAYSLGVGSHGFVPALVLQLPTIITTLVEGYQVIDFEGELVPLVVQTGFITPEPL